jgi:hypothetical protein
MLGKNSTVLMVMLIIGFVGFLGSVFTGSLALTSIATGFFGGATCMIAYNLMDRLPEGGLGPKPKPNMETKNASIQELKEAPRFTSFKDAYANLNKPKEVPYVADQVHDDIPFID